MKKVKNIRLHPSSDSLNDLLSTSQSEYIFWIHLVQWVSGFCNTLQTWVHFCLKSLPIVKKTELHLQAQSDLLTLLFAFNYQNYSRYLTTHHVELTNLSSKNPSAYKDLQTYDIGASLSGKRFSTIPGDLVTEVTINREVKIRGWPMRGEYSTSFDAENYFVLNSHILAELRKELKSKMGLKTASTHKETT